MSNVSFARIMYGSGDGPRSDYGLNSSGGCFSAAPPLVTISSPPSEAHNALTLEDLLHRAWQALSTRR